MLHVLILRNTPVGSFAVSGGGVSAWTMTNPAAAAVFPGG